MGEMAQPWRSRLWQALKGAIDRACLVVVAPCAWTCTIERALGPEHETLFSFWAQSFALVPGLPGVFLRRAFYRQTLRQCASRFVVGFGALFSHRDCIVEEAVYIGPYAIVGASVLRRGCLIGSRASVVSGSALHPLDASGRRLPTSLRRLRVLEIGEEAWLGEASVVMADVGAAAVVAAGSVVSSRVLAGIVVAGNPARFVRHVALPANQEESASAAL